MATLDQVVKTLHEATGAAELVIDRTADKLIEANYLPETDLLPEDAAMLMVALAAGRAPIDAVDVAEAYLAAPLVSSPALTDPTRRPNEKSEFSLADGSVVGSVAVILEQMATRTKGRHAGAISLDLVRPPNPACAKLIVRLESGLRVFKFAAPLADLSCWQVWLRIEEPVFAAVAAEFGRISRSVSEQLAATLRPTGLLEIST